MQRRRFIAHTAGMAALSGAALPAAMAADADASARPTVEPYDWRSVPFGGGGYIDGFLFHPREAGLLYCRTDIGGAYRFDPQARRWWPLLDHLDKADADLMGVLSLAVDPRDADRLYALCGLYLSKEVRDGALLASTDRGRSWTVHELGVKVGGNSPGRGSGERLQVDPWAGEVLYLGSSQDGLLKSTDRGRRFRQLDLPVRHVSLVLMDPASGSAGKPASRLYVGSHDQPGLYVSDDGGKTFQREPGTPAQAPQHAAIGPDGVLYVAFAIGDGVHVANPSYATTGGIWKRDPGHGRPVWTEITPVKPGIGLKGFGYSGLDVDRQQPGRLIVSTIERWAEGDDLFLSEDGGAHWTALGARSRHEVAARPWLANYKRATRRPDPMGHWIADVKIDPFNSARAVYGTGYGLWMTDNLTQATQAARTAGAAGPSDVANAADAAGTVNWRFEVNNIEETATLEIRSPSGGAALLAAMGDVSGAAWDDLTQSPATGLFAPSNETNRSVDVAELEPRVLARTSDHVATGGYASIDGGKSWRAFGPSDRVAKTAQGHRAPTGLVAVSAKGGFMVWAPERQPALWSKDQGRRWARCDGWPADPGPLLAPVADRAVEGVFYLLDRAQGRVLMSVNGGQSFAPALTGLPALNDGQNAQLISAPGRGRDLWLALPHGLFRLSGTENALGAPSAIPPVAEAWMVALGKAAPGAPYHAIYVWGRVSAGGASPVEGYFRSDDEGRHFVRIGDALHRYGRLLSMTADPLTHGTVFLAPHGRGVIIGRPQSKAKAQP
ncbi:hypothetical protein [Roseateles amylovorans]|uniref:Xyloglucanase n=1 Tax=Roseateles amylovorans TaxID=2978473 RepID=A0ABY6B8C2_9BURK|nr:hypothetical protein [Roseateles amylovorans]UXH80715.1 hypothetical protein N4261_12895 [Roseateles amylovorans]